MNFFTLQDETSLYMFLNNILYPFNAKNCRLTTLVVLILDPFHSESSIFDVYKSLYYVTYTNVTLTFNQIWETF